MLNANATEFVPQVAPVSGAVSPDESLPEPSEEELRELEEAENWVALQVELEEAEREHLIAYAIACAPEEKLLEVEAAQGVFDGSA